MNLKSLWINPNRKQIRIKATTLLSEISTHNLGYVCFALNRIIFRSDKFWQIGNLFSPDDLIQSSDVNRDLVNAYPEVFIQNMCDDTLLELWVKPELFEKIGYNDPVKLIGRYSLSHASEAIYSCQKFRIDLFTYIVDTYGDREIVFNFNED